MGNRAIVRFDDERGSVAGIYLHWNGSSVKEWLRNAAPRMRKGDAGYAAARFCGYCHENIGGGLSLSIMRGEDCIPELAQWQDNGMYIVDCLTGKVKHVHGPDRNGRGFTIKLGEF